MRMNAAAVMLNDLLQRLESPIVHIGRRQRDVPQRRRFELAVICGSKWIIRTKISGSETLIAVIEVEPVIK